MDNTSNNIGENNSSVPNNLNLLENFLNYQMSTNIKQGNDLKNNNRLNNNISSISSISELLSKMLFNPNILDVNKKNESINESHINLSNTNSSHINLSNINLSHINLSDINLSHINLSDINLSHINLSDIRANNNPMNLKLDHIDEAIQENPKLLYFMPKKKTSYYRNTAFYLYKTLYTEEFPLTTSLFYSLVLLDGYRDGFKNIIASNYKVMTTREFLFDDKEPVEYIKKLWIDYFEKIENKESYEKNLRVFVNGGEKDCVELFLKEKWKNNVGLKIIKYKEFKKDPDQELLVLNNKNCQNHKKGVFFKKIFYADSIFFSSIATSCNRALLKKKKVREVSKANKERNNIYSNQQVEQTNNQQEDSIIKKIKIEHMDI